MSIRPEILDSNPLVGVFFDDINEISSASLQASSLLEDRIVDKEIAELIRVIQSYAQKIILYSQEIDQPDE